MVFHIICLVIILIKFISMKSKSIHSNLSRKQRLWFRLPYQLRLRIEHKLYVCNVLKNNCNSIQMSPIRKRICLKLAPYYDEVLSLNNPYRPFINAPISDEEVAYSINNFLKRFQ